MPCGARILCLLVVTPLALVSPAAGAQRAAAPNAVTTAAISPADLRTRLYLIADDSLRGRLAGSAGDSVVTAYIASELARVGLAAGGEMGGWFQNVRYRDRGNREPTI